MAFRQLFLLVFLVFTGCGEIILADNSSRILVMGDSLMAVNRTFGAAVADAIEDELDEPVTDRSVIGARVLGIIPISAQYTEGDWDWIVMNGNGNDILFGCGCRACDRKVTRLISEDGQSGAIPDMVRTLRETGARVIYTGYLRTPGVTGPIEDCAPIGDEMDQRLERMAEADDGVIFVSLADIVPFGDRSYHGLDLVHPSIKGSAAIGSRIAEVIRRAEN